MNTSQTDYEKYIRTDELLALQKTDEELCCPDELSFQMVHQIAELHFKLILQYLDQASQYTADGKAEEATTWLRRANFHLQQLPGVFESLEYMEPIRYHQIRLFLGRGSGQDSPGFNRILQQAPMLWEPFSRLLASRSLTLLELHQNPQAHYGLFMLLQEMIRLDELFQSFRSRHILLVKRMIGLEAKSLKGIPAKALEHGARTSFFPELWRVISELTDWTGSSEHPGEL